MFRLFALLLFCLVICGFYSIHPIVPRTISVAVQRVPFVDSSFLLLGQDNITIRRDSILNELIVDLVMVKEADSILQKRTQRHRSGFGWLLAPFGIKWKAISMHRRKFVGTAKRDIGNPDKPEYTEYDINIDLMAHTPKHMALVWEGNKRQKEINKHKLKGRDPNQPPFIEPTLQTSNQYRIHCELTPPQNYLNQLTELFYPVSGHKGFAGHHNFGEPKPTIGVYGAFVSDCNHNCHAEIHPYEWIWWLDVNPAKDSLANEKRWLVGLQRESSNRFRRWSKRPRVGMVSVPFLFSVNDAKPTIAIEHLLHSNFVENGLKTLPEVPADAMDANFTEMEVKLTGLDKSLTVTTNKPLETDAVRLWLSSITTDGKWVYGYVNIAASVTDLYTARVTVKSN